MPNYFDDLRERLAMTAPELGRGEDFPSVQNPPQVTGYSTYQGGYEQPENAIPMSPEILDYLQGKMPERFSPETRQALVSQSESAGKSLILPELIANLGGAIAGQGGLTASPQFDKLRQRQYEQTVGAFDKEKASEQNRLMEIANYLRLANRPQWDAEANRVRMDLLAKAEARKQAEFDYRKNIKDPRVLAQVDARIQAQKEGLELANKKLLSGQTFNLAEKLAPLVEAQRSFDDIEALLPPPGTEIPGIGPIDRNFPGYMLSPEGAQIRALVQHLQNAIIYAASGKAINEEEAKRLQAALALSPGSTQEQFRANLKYVRERLGAAAENWKAGTLPEAVKTYKEQGGRELRNAPSERTPAPHKAAPATDPKVMQAIEVLEASGDPVKVKRAHDMRKKLGI